METPRQQCARLIVALQDIADQEGASVRSGDMAMVRSLQERAAPLVEWLVQNGPAIADAEIRRQIAAILALREKSARLLATAAAQARAEVESLNGRQRTIARIAPVYGKPAPVRRQLTAIG
jgi:hypothetical protein